MACCAQLINCLNSLYLAHEDQFCITPVGHVFAMYRAHQGGQSLRTNFSAPRISYDRDGKPAWFWGLHGSASLQGKTVVLTAVNPDVSKPLETQIVLQGGSAKAARATVLTAPDIHARNTFAAREQVMPKSQGVGTVGGNLSFRFPPASVAKLEIELL